MYAGEVFCCYLKRTEGKNNRQKTKDGTEKKDFHRYHHYTNFLLKREALFRKNWKLEKDLQRKRQMPTTARYVVGAWCLTEFEDDGNLFGDIPVFRELTL